MKFRYLTSNVHSMMCLGLWPCWKNKLMQWIHNWLIVSIQLLNVLSCTTNLIRCKGHVSCSLENLCYLIIIYLGVIEYCTYNWKHDVLKTCIYKLHVLNEQFGCNKHTEKAETMVKFITRLFNLYAAVGILLYNASAFFIYNDCMLEDKEFVATPCGLQTASSMPFDIYRSPGFDIGFIFLFWAAVQHVFCVLHSLMLPCGILLHITGHIEELKSNLNFIAANDNENLCDQLKNCILHHIAITEFVIVAQKTFKFILFMTMSSMALIMSITCFQIIFVLLSNPNVWLLIKFFAIFLGWFTMLCLMTHSGQVCVDASKELVDTVYNIPWYNESSDFKVLLRMMLMRSQRPLGLSVIAMSMIDHGLLSAILGTTYSYATVMIKLVQDEVSST